MPNYRKLTWVAVTVLVLVTLSTVSVFAAEACVVKQRMNCSGIDLTGYHFDGAALRNSTMDDANMTSTTMYGTNWSGSSMQNTDFTNAITVNADFRRVDFTGSNITQAQFDAAFSYQNAILPDGTKARRNNK